MATTPTAYTVLIVQHGRLYAAFRSDDPGELIGPTDDAHADKAATENPNIEIGYFDVLKIAGTVDAATFSDWATSLPRRIVVNATDADIHIR